MGFILHSIKPCAGVMGFILHSIKPCFRSDADNKIYKCCFCSDKESDKKSLSSSDEIKLIAGARRGTIYANVSEQHSAAGYSPRRFKDKPQVYFFHLSRDQCQAFAGILQVSWPVSGVCRNWLTECVIRRLSARTHMPHRDGNSRVRFFNSTLGSETGKGIAKIKLWPELGIEPGPSGPRPSKLSTKPSFHTYWLLLVSCGAIMAVGSIMWCHHGG